MPSATVTTTATAAITLPVGAYGVILANSSDETIYYLIGTPASASAPEGAGIPLAVDAQAARAFRDALVSPLQVNCYHAGSGDKTLTYEVLYQAVDAIQ